MRIMTLVAVAVVSLSAAACTPQSERQRDIRDYDRLDFEALFREFSRRCKARGGILVIDRTGRLRKNGTPRRTDSYRCM